MNTRITAGILAITLAVGTVAVSSGDASAQRWARHGGWGHHGGWNHNHGGWGHRGGWGAAGAGFAAGALLGGALASRPYYGYDYGEPGYYAAAPGGDRDDAYCSQRFKSYDPASGTYLGYDGNRHPCP